MGNGLVSKFRWHYFAAVAIFLTLVGMGASWITGDPHYLSRVGAAVAAIGAILVVLQIRYDIAVERAFQKRLREIEATEETTSSVLIGQVADRIKEQSKRSAEHDVENSRTSAAIIVAIITAYGELLHGWGDSFMRLLVLEGH